MFKFLKNILARSESPHSGHPEVAIPTDSSVNHTALLSEASLRKVAGDMDAAAEIYLKILDSSPDHPEANYRLGLLKKKQGDYSEAAQHLMQAAESESTGAIYYHEAGQVYELLEEFDDALYCYQMALHVQPDHGPSFLRLVRLHLDRRENRSALEIAQTWAERCPDTTSAHIELAGLYVERERFEEAVEQYQRALELEPENAEALIRYGNLLYKVDRLDESLEVLDKALKLAPHQLSARIDRAWVYRYQGRFDEALREFDYVLQHEPQNFLARWGRCHVYLSIPDFEKGWEDYACRFMASEAHFRPLPFPFWKGEPLEGKTLLVYAEQGLGDEIMFASCIPDVIAQAQSILIECEPRLEKLFRRSFPAATVYPASKTRNHSWLSGVSGIDLQIPIGNLPLYLRKSVADFPQHSGYLQADPDRVRYWKTRLDELGQGLKIGFSWRGGTSGTRQISRTMALDTCLPIFRTPRTHFINLQYGDCRQELAEFQTASSVTLHHWQEAHDDYDETAALVSALDLVVTVCTSLVHLTGALGKPVWIMAPAVPEWRYGVSGDSMPWYPSSRLFRQPQLQQWEQVVASVARELPAFRP